MNRCEPEMNVDKANVTQGEYYAEHPSKTLENGRDGEGRKEQNIDGKGKTREKKREGGGLLPRGIREGGRP